MRYSKVGKYGAPIIADQNVVLVENVLRLYQYIWSKYLRLLDRRALSLVDAGTRYRSRFELPARVGFSFIAKLLWTSLSTYHEFSIKVRICRPVILQRAFVHPVRDECR